MCSSAGARRVKLLQLTYDVSLVPPGGAQVVASVGTFLKTAGKDAAGHAFHHFSLLQAGLLEREQPSDGDESAPDDTATADDSDQRSQEDDKSKDGVQWKHKKENKKSKKKDKRKDLYALLGLEDQRWMATDAQIKKAYQKQALKHHPDKACAGVKDTAEKERLEEKFKSILEAFETLSDASKRREFDSTDKFDDSLPEACKAEDFFVVFGAAFRRQARWSERRPVPDLGERDAEYAAVQAFYDFWYGFRSWREFPHEDEEDPECAECREHRRWIDRENARLRARAKKDETKRIRDFVDRAYAADPRIRAQKAAVKAERERRVAERAAAATAKADEAKAAAAAAAAAAEVKAAEDKAAADVARKARQQDQRELRRQRKRLRDLCARDLDGEPLLDTEDAEDLCKELPRGKLEALCGAIEGAGGEEGMRAAVAAAVDEMYGSRGEEARRKQQARAAAAAEGREKRKAALKEKVAAAREWDEEEVRLLDKALVKFPVGVPRRWEQITAYLRTRTQEEVIFMCKVKQGAHASKVQQADWRSGRKGGVNADVGIGADADDRHSAFTDVQVKTDGGGAAANGTAEPSNGADNAASPAPAAAAADGGERKNGTPAAAAAAGGAEWSKAQELALIKALKAIGKDVPDRWARIAEKVDGRSMIDCRKRFQDMKAKARPAAGSA